MTCHDTCLEAAQTRDVETQPAFVPCEFRVKWATAGWERDGALALRRAVFCAEQQVFDGDDLDAIDTSGAAQTLVALSMLGGNPDAVAGTVRIHSPEPGLWWGSRLAVAAPFRQHGRIGATLIRLAVSSAHAMGCRIFLAHVQGQNEAMFARLGWHTLKHVHLHGREHALMQADLDAYPPCFEPWSGYVTRSTAVARSAEARA
ncbi:MAG: MSMEG_0567/Sll0786 family nitrogen starvation N-acetyltransferase [Leptothrix sp. (in: b-proteobacteria)]